MGHPDGQAYALWRAAPIGAGHGVLFNNANPISAASYVTNYASLQITTGGVPPAGATFVVNFFTDATGTQNTGTYQIGLAKGQFLNVTIPIKGNYVSVNLTTTDVAGVNITYAFTPTNVTTPKPAYMSVGASVLGNNVNVNAGATVIAIPPEYATGPGYWFAFDPNSTAKIQARLITLNLDGTEAVKLDLIATLANLYRQEFFAPVGPTGLAITNTDALAHPVDYALIIDGR